MTAKIDSPRAFQDFLGSFASTDDLMKSLNDKGEEGFGNKVEGYITTMVAEKTTEAVDLNKQITEQVQTVLADMLGDKKKAKALNLNPQDARTVASGRVGARANPNALGVPLDGLFGSVGEYVQAMWHKAGATTAEQRGKVLAYVEKIPAEGGYLVPEEFRAELLRHSLEFAVVRPRARVVPMNSAKLSFPAIDETSRAASIHGGVVVYRTEEAAVLTASQAAFKRVTLELTKQAALANVSNELIRDTAGAINTYLLEIVPEAMAFAEDDDYMNGSGVGEPLGMLAAANAGLVAVAKETGQVATTIVWENIVKMYARMLPGSLQRAVWVVTPDAFPQLATMGLIVGTGGSAVGIAADGTGAPTMTLLGRPIVITEKARGVVGAQGDISLVDFGYYLIGDGQRLEFASSEHALFTQDMTSMRWIQRNDGRPWVTTPLTPKNGGPTLAPAVQLAVRS